MKDRLITLFGGGGFIGRYLTQDLLRAGARVRIAERSPRDSWFMKTLGGVGQTQFVAADLTRPETVERAVAGSDAVVNLVGIFDGNLEAIHVRGARSIAEAASKTGVGAMVHVSALGADAKSPSVYSRTKAMGERAVSAAFPAATIMRPSVNFGREDQFINRFAGMVAASPVVPVLKADAKFQPVYVADTAAAIAHALAEPGVHGGKTYSLGGPDVISMGKLVRWIAHAVGRDPSIIELPDMVGSAIASLGFLPGAPISRDQWLMLQSDNVVPAGAEGLAALGIDPVPMTSVAPGWLVQYRRQGRFGGKAAA